MPATVEALQNSGLCHGDVRLVNKARLATKIAMVNADAAQNSRADQYASPETLVGSDARLGFHHDEAKQHDADRLAEQQTEEHAHEHRVGQKACDGSIPARCTSAFVNANRGRTRKYTHGYSLFSSLVAGGMT